MQLYESKLYEMLLSPIIVALPAALSYSSLSVNITSLQHDPKTRQPLWEGIKAGPNLRGRL